MVAWSSALTLLALTTAGLGKESARPVLPADLLRTVPFDRITLTDGTVVGVEPVSPRPLPAPEPKEKRRTRENAFEPPPGGNIGLPGEKSKIERPKDQDDPTLEEITVHLLQGELRDYRLKRSHIKKIEYFEDMLLAEAERYAILRDFARAFECCLRVRAFSPRWKGLDEHVHKLLFAEGSAALLDGDGEQGLRLLRELHARKPDFPGLADKLATSYGVRINHAFELGLFRKARRILHELEPLAPDHQLVRDLRARFVARAREWVQKAEKLEGAERVDALAAALRVWPALEGAGALYAEAFKAAPTLEVAVIDLPRPAGPWVRSPADERVTRLMFLPVLARDDEDAAQGKHPGQLAAALESSDVGRKLVLTLRTGVPWSDGSRPVSAIDVARALTDRTETTSPLYNARWADLLDRVDAPDESRLEVRLTRPFVRPGFWLLGPVGPAHAGFDGRVATVNRGRSLVGDGPFRAVASDADSADYRAPGAGHSPGTGRVHRIREVRLLHPNAAVGALLRGDVTLVEHVPPDRLADLAGDPEIKVGRHARPSLHRLACDGRNPALRNRALRRGLSYAIDRKSLLEETLLRHPADAGNVPSDGPFPKGSYADAREVKALGYDPLLARMLVAAAQKELGGQPIKLTLQYPALPEARAVVPKLAEMFQLVGVEVVATERSESALESDLRSGRRFDLAYRATPCDEPVMEAGPLICPGYDAPPSADALASVVSPRILQLLLQLERAPEFPTAKGLVLQIDREGRDELPVLPLWQLEDHYAWRTRLKGPAESAERLYEGIETWEIEPWFAKDPW